MRTVFTLVVVALATFTLGPVVVLAGFFGAGEKRNRVQQWCMHRWARVACWAAGVRIVVHDDAGIEQREGMVYIANHVSWFDVFALAATLPRYSFVAKSELRRIPVFGAAAAAAGIVFLERDNRKQAFESYKDAAAQVKAGRSIVVYPEGTRGYDYPLRPFKKGPFVLAIASEAPLVPTVIHGTRDVMRKGSFRVRGGEIHLHFLKPIPTAGLSYNDRAALMTRVWQRIADTLTTQYGIPPTDRSIAKPNERVV